MHCRSSNEAKANPRSKNKRKYKPISSSKDRYTLFEAKETMMESMGLKGDETPALKFLRTGYQTCTWWEDPKDYDREASDNWRK